MHPLIITSTILHVSILLTLGQDPLICGVNSDSAIGMDMDRPELEIRTINVLIRITPEMHAELSKLADKMGKGWGVATVMRQIVQNALDEGVNVRGRRKARSNGEARTS